MATAADKPAWYRIYVLFVLLAVCVSNLACRNLPSYLITVPVPDCEDLCEGVAIRPLCGSDELFSYPSDRDPTPYETCQLCRARVLPLSTKAAEEAADAAGAATSDEAAATAVAAGSALQTDAAVSADLVDAEPSLAHKHVAPVGWLVPQSSGKDQALHSKSRRHFVREFGGQAYVYWDENLQKSASFYSLADGACLSHWTYGILIGYGFAFVFAIGSLPAGPMCDRRSRVGIASAALLAWSVATSLQAASHSFGGLLMCRAVVGLAQAFAMPACISLAADYFAGAHHAAVAVLSVGLYLGSGCASFSVMVAQAVGWRWAVMLTGLGGIALTPVLYHTVLEPERTEWSAPCAVEVVMEEVFEKSRVARLTIVAASAKMLAAYCLAAFLPIWYSRRNLTGYSTSLYACSNALVIPAGGLLATVLGTMLSHQWSKRDSRAPCWIGLLGAVLSVPLVCFVLLAQSFAVSMFSLFLLLLASESWFGPTVTLLQASVRRSVRGQAVSIFLVASTLVANLGPALVGILDPGGERIRVHLLWICITANVIAAVAFVLTAWEISVDPVAIGLGNKADDGYAETPGNRVNAALWSLF